MDWRAFGKDKIKIALEGCLAIVLAVVIAIAANTGVLDKKGQNAKGPQSGEQERLNKAAAENEAAKSKSTKPDESGKATAPGKAADSGKTTGSAADSSTTSSGSDKSDSSEEVIADGQYPIMGKSNVTVEEMVNYFNSSGEKYPAQVLGKGGADNIETFCQMYHDEAQAEGVRPEVAFVQTMKETGWLQYGGDASINQFNFAGLGTTGGGVAGNSYPDVRTGIRAQIQHLKAYATADSLSQACVDDRYQYVTKGSAPYVEWLGQKENPEGHGWATAQNYGYSIVDMISKLKHLGRQ